MTISVIRKYTTFMEFLCKLVLLFSLASSHCIPSRFSSWCFHLLFHAEFERFPTLVALLRLQKIMLFRIS